MSLNDTVILDQWDNAMFRESVAVVYLDYQTMYPLTVTYHQNGIIARIALQWESSAAGLDRQPLPSMNMYHSLTHLSGSPFSFSWAALTAIVLNKCRPTFPGNPLITVFTVGDSFTFTVDLRDKYDNLVASSAANLYFALLSYEAANIYAHSGTSFASSSAGVTLAGSLLTFTFTPLVASANKIDIRCGLLGSGGLFGTYYQDPDMNLPVSTQIASTVDFSDSGSSPVRWPSASFFLDNLQFAARWQGMITPTAAGVFTFEAPVADSDDRVRLWVSNARLLNFWFENSTLRVAKCCTVANTIDVTEFSLLLDDPVSFSGVVPSNITAGTVYFVFAPTPTSFQIRATAGTGSAIVLTGSLNFYFGFSPLIYRATIQFPVANVPYPITVDFFHYSGSKRMQLKWIVPSFASAVVPSASFSRVDPFPRFPYSISVKALSFCATRSQLSGRGLSIATYGTASSFSITARDKFDNIVTDPSLRFVAAARPSSPGNLPATFASISNVGNGIFSALYVPSWSTASSIELTARPDQQCPASDGGLSIGAVETGLSATYYRGTYSDSLDPSTWAMAVAYVSPVSDLSGILFGFAANPGFVARFRGIIISPFAGTYTFSLVTQAKDSSEMVRLTVGTRVVIATVATPCSACVCTAGTCSGFSGTVDMAAGAMYDILVDFQDTRYSARSLALQWTMAPFFNAVNVPTSAFIRENCNNAFVAAQQPSGINAFKCFKGVAAHSVASGNSLTLATAGVAGTFSVTVKDSFGTIRGTTAAPDFVFCNGTMGSSSVGDFHGWSSTAVTVSDGVYSCSFTTTRSGTYTVYNQVFRPGGLMGNYYGNYFFYGTPGSSSVSTVYFNWTSAVTGKSSLSFVAARYVGLIYPAYTGTYQIQVSVNAGDEIALWINGQIKLNASTLRQSANATDAMVFGTSFVCTYAMTANNYYDLRLEYKDFGGPSFLQLQWQSTLQYPQIIPSSRLFWAVTSASFSTQYVKSSNVLSTITVGSQPAPLIASIYGNGVTACTAGVAALFTLIARDTFSNIRESEQLEAGSWMAVAFSDAGQVAPSLVFPSLTWSGAIPGYIGSYTPNFAGSLSVHVSRSVVGGLIATYYPNIDLVDPVRVSFAANVNHASVNDDAEATSAEGVNWPGTANTRLRHHHFSARWSGFIKATQTSPATFTVALGDNDDQTRLYINNVPVINRWDNSVGGTEQTAVVSFTANQMYFIKLEYRETAGFHGIQLKLNTVVIPSSDLYMQQEVMGSRCCVSNAYPAPVCGSTTKLSGVGLSLQTVGIISTFRLTIRDAFSNVRTLSSIGTDLNLAFQQFLSPVAPAALVAPMVKVNLTNLKNGVFSSSYMVTTAGALPISAQFYVFEMFDYMNSGPSLLHVLSPIRGGLSATYYSGTSFGPPDAM